MKTIITINDKPVEIELTSEQVLKIKNAAVNYTDIKTEADAIDFLGEEDADVKVYKTLEAQNLPSDIIAYALLKVIVKALNGGVFTDYKDANVYKYYPWFNSVGSSAGFSFFDYGYVRSCSGVGSRLLLIDSDRAKHAAKYFTPIYNNYINS